MNGTPTQTSRPNAMCSIHPNQPALEVCTNILHRSAPLLCKGCKSEHATDHRHISVSAFIADVNRSHNTVLDLLKREGEKLIRSQRQTMSSIESVRRDISGFCTYWSDELRDHYGKCTRWIDTQVFSQASSRIGVGNQETIPGDVSESISSNIEFYLTKDRYLEQLTETLRALPIEINGLRRITNAAEEISLEDASDTALSMIANLMRIKEPPTVDVPEEVPLFQTRRLRSSKYYDRPEKISPMRPYLHLEQTFQPMSELGARMRYFQRAGLQISEPDQVAWSDVLRMAGIQVHYDTATFKPADTNALPEQAIFMSLRVAQTKQTKWAVAMLRMQGNISVGFAEVTSEEDPHRYYCIDSTGKCHTNTPYVIMKSFPYKEMEMIRFWTSLSADNRLRVEYNIDQDRLGSFEIDQPNTQLRFFVSFDTVGDSARLLKLFGE